jgi:hypothetical protein
LLLILVTFPPVAVRPQPYQDRIARAEEYLVHRFTPSLGLIYESDDSGQHWLRSEFPNFSWNYNQTFWLYSDNLFAYRALKRDYPLIANRITDSIAAYRQPLSNMFEVLLGQRISLPLHNPEDYVVVSDAEHIVMIRPHNASTIAVGEYVDFWMYEALEHSLEGDLATSALLVHQAEGLWRQEGLWDWSFTIHDHKFSNQKLALLLFTARALGIGLEHEREMESHLWSMQNEDGGIASLSDPNGVKTGSANAETTALTILVYDDAALARFPKIQFSSANRVAVFGIALFISLAICLAAWCRRSVVGRKADEP